MCIRDRVEQLDAALGDAVGVARNPAHSAGEADLEHGFVGADENVDVRNEFLDLVDTTKTVSYTHLDVYKRQSQRRACESR